MTSSTGSFSSGGTSSIHPCLLQKRTNAMIEPTVLLTVFGERVS